MPDNGHGHGIAARYDVAQTTVENAQMWKHVDSLSAAAANSPTVRKTIRERARYEVANNSIADGIIDTIVADLIGPWITIKLGRSEVCRRAEKAFNAWAVETRLWQKLNTIVRAKKVDGEGFALLTTNKHLRHNVKLDIYPFECDMVESWWVSPKEDEIDGIRFDMSTKTPLAYRILDQHPGDYRAGLRGHGGGKWISSEFVIHYFSDIRPGQVRGVSELTPALTLFGQLRSYTQAVITCATRAAEYSGVMETDLVPDSVAAEVDPLTSIQAERNTIVSLPEGWKLNQLKAEQPTTTYAMFKKEIISEIARCLNLPLNVALCDSSSYNYASGRLDHQTYDRNLEVERYNISSSILDRVYAAWLEEYAALESLSLADIKAIETSEWLFTSRGHVDPNKEASADDIRLKNGTLTLQAYYSKNAEDWEDHADQWINEQISLEQKWNAARVKAGLAPAPLPKQGQSTINVGDGKDAEQTDKTNDA